MMLVIQTLAAVFATVTFMTLLNVPKQYLSYCGIIGGAGWFLYCVLWRIQGLFSEPIVVFLSTVLVIILARFFAVKKRCPVIVFLISGIIPMVPGAGIYWTAYYLVTNQLEEAFAKGFLAVKIAAAIVLGIVVVFELPQGMFRRISDLFEKKERTKG